MLYAAWQEIVRSSRREPAIFTSLLDRPITFEQLERRLDRRSTSLSRLPLYSNPAGRPIEFIIDTLVSWRDNRPLVPLDSPVTPQLEHSLASLPEQVAHVKITSGSSGVPRPIAFSAVQLAADASQIADTMGLTPTSTNIVVVSLAHSYGFSNLVLPLLLHGIPLSVADSPLPEGMRILLAAHRTCTLPAVPAMWHAWHKANLFSHNSPRLAISAGAPLDPVLEGQIYSSVGLKVHNFYGASECGGIAYDQTLFPREPDNAPAGTPIDGVSLDVDDSGRLLISSPATAISYLDDLSLSASPLSPAITGRTFHSTDLARFENGQLFLSGRVTDVINLAGRKLDPSMVENCLGRLEGIRHCLVFGIPSPDPTRSEVTVACIHPDTGFDLKLAKADLSSVLSSWQLPRHWWITDELAPDHRGKMSRHHWRQRYLATRQAHDAVI